MREETRTTQLTADPGSLTRETASAPGVSWRWVFWTLAFMGLVLDQASKYTVFARLYDETRKQNELPLVQNVFSFSVKYTHEPIADAGWRGSLQRLGGLNYLPHVNRGALWGIGGRDEHEPPGSDFNNFFAWISLLAALGIVVWSTRPAARRDRILCTSLGLILAGTLGNLYDRVVFSGVRDFLDWHYLFQFPVFNVADCCLVCGAFLLLLQAFSSQPYAAVTPASAGTASAGPLSTATTEVH